MAVSFDFAEFDLGAWIKQILPISRNFVIFKQLSLLKCNKWYFNQVFTSDTVHQVFTSDTVQGLIPFKDYCKIS